MFDTLRADINRFGGIFYSKKKKVPIFTTLKILFKNTFNYSMHIVIAYRISNFCYKHKIPLISFIIGNITKIIYGVDIPKEVEIGKGFYICHFGNIIIHPKVKIGENCSLSHEVTIGIRNENLIPPVIGNMVYFGAGAKVLGKIKVGNKVKIGANAVVIKDVPSNSTAVGVPAKIIKRNEVSLKNI